MKISYKSILFYIFFISIGYFLMQVPFSQMIGAKDMRFSLFDFYAPTAGAFLGAASGTGIVLGMHLVNWAMHGFPLELAVILRFFPVLFAVLYFSKKRTWTLVFPAVAMIGFWLHPEGRKAWYFALYWAIPFLTYFFHGRFLFARALGATFTQHSIGGLLWIWALNMKAEMWMGLFPIVWKERMLMALGITLTYMACNYLLSVLQRRFHTALPVLTLSPKYSIAEKKYVHL